MKRCQNPACGFPNPDHRTTCYKCHQPLDDPHLAVAPQPPAPVVSALQQCQFCKADVPPDAKKCKQCGEWLAGNRSVRLYVLIAAVIVLLSATIILATRKVPILRSLTIERVTVSQVRKDVLRYNHKEVKIRATIVDAADEWTRWVIADDWHTYSTCVASYFARRYGGPKTMGPEDLYIKVAPMVRTVDLKDVVEVVGTYDADANLLTVTDVKKVGHSPD